MRADNAAKTKVSVRSADRSDDLQSVRLLFQEYEKGTGVDLCFQNFAAELAGLPGDYARPGGTLLLCRVNGRPAGCIAVRRLRTGDCEMKRLYVRGGFRGLGLGRRLASRAIAFARSKGYRRMFLDTLPIMAVAQRMYEDLGFVETKPYRFNPVEGARYMRLSLGKPAATRTTLTHRRR
jgi:putative acetyltransferase